MLAWKKDVIIVDEDPVIGKLTKNLLIDAGISVYLVNKPFDTLTILKKYKPKAVILDIMFSQVSGLKLCRLIRKDSSLKDVKIIFVSQKDYNYEKQEAFKLGCDAFITKPYNVEIFAKQVQGIMTNKHKETAALEAEETDEMPEQSPSFLKETDVHVNFWGMREIEGLMPAGDSEYGMQTPCVSVETAESVIIFDGGSGIINLGETIMNNGGPKDLWVLLTNLHMAHIMGLPYFACAKNSNFTLRIMAAVETEKRFKDAIEDIFFASPYWNNSPAKAKLMMYETAETSYDIDENISVSAIFVNHPSLTAAYKLTLKDKTIVYVPANEILGDASAMENTDEKLSSFARNADLFIHDCYYNDNDYEINRGQGHSSLFNLAEFAAESAQVKKCVLFTSNPLYTDEVIEKMLNKARRKAADRKWSTKFYSAKEGLKIKL